MMKKIREYPKEMTGLVFKSEKGLLTEYSETKFDERRISDQKVLEEWRNGKIICRRYFFPSKDDIEMV